MVCFTTDAVTEARKKMSMFACLKEINQNIYSGYLWMQIKIWKSTCHCIVFHIFNNEKKYLKAQDMSRRGYTAHSKSNIASLWVTFKQC